MSYRLLRFGGIDLPWGLAATPFDTGSFKSPVDNLPAGNSYRALGRQRARRHGLTIPYKGRYWSDIDYAYIQDLQDLRELAGTYAKLERRRLDQEYTEWIMAEMTYVNGDLSPENRRYVDVQTVFVCDGEVWNGSSRSSGGSKFGASTSIFGIGLVFGPGTTNHYVLFSSSMFIQPLQGGNMDIHNVTITLTCGSSPLSSITFASALMTPAIKFTWTGATALNPGEKLIINAGSKDIQRLSGTTYTDEWNNLTFDYSVHKTTDWFTIEAAPTPHGYNVSWVGGSNNSTLDFSYSDGWI